MALLLAGRRRTTAWPAALDPDSAEHHLAAISIQVGDKTDVQARRIEAVLKRVGPFGCQLRSPGNPAAEQVQRHLHGESTDALAVAQELPVQGESAGGIGEADVHGAQRNLIAG